MNVQATAPRTSLVFRLAMNSLVQVAGSVTASLIALFTFVTATRGLGPSSYGDFVAATVFLYVPVVLADLGLPTVVLREIAAQPSRTAHAMRAVIPLRLLISTGAVMTAVGIGVAMPLTEGAKLAILIGSFGAFATLMNLALLPVLQAQLRMHWAVVANVAGRLVTLALTLGAVWADLGLAGVAWAQTIGLALTLAIDLVIVSRFVSLKPVLDLPYWRDMLRSSLVLGLAIGLSLVIFRIDSLLLALIRPAREVGLYGAAFKFLELSDLVATAVGISAFPLFARFAATGDLRVRGLTQKAFDVLLAAAAAIGLVMLIYPEELIRLTAGSEYLEGAVAIQILSVYPLLAFVNGLFWRLLIADSRDRTLLAIAAGGLAVNVVLNVVFLPLYGFQAAAVVAVVTEILAVAVVGIVVRRTQGYLPRLDYAWAIASAAAVMLAIALFAPGPTVLAAALSTAAYALVLALLPGTGREVLAGIFRRGEPPRS